MVNKKKGQATVFCTHHYLPLNITTFYLKYRLLKQVVFRGFSVVTEVLLFWSVSVG
jgi:hypothetical protein